MTDVEWMAWVVLVGWYAAGVAAVALCGVLAGCLTALAQWVLDRHAEPGYVIVRGERS